MIFQNHIIKSVLQGTLVTLAILTCISAFVTFVGQLDDIGTKEYGFYEALIYVALKLPKQVVFTLPISVFIGSILSLGALASNNELIVMQASGMSIKRLVMAVLKAATIIVLINLVMQEWVVPIAESSATQGRSAAKKGMKNYIDNESVWTKENNRIVHVEHLGSDGKAKGIKIFELDDNRRLIKALRASAAISSKEGWVLKDVNESLILPSKIKTQFHEKLIYPGTLTVSLLQSMRMTPVKMSLTDLYHYQIFLEINGLENGAEKIMFWRRAYSSLAILIMCTLSIPFVLGSQRSGQTGQRIMLGIMVGLSFVAIERLVVRGAQFLEIVPSISTLIPLLIFLVFNVFMMHRAIEKKGE